MTTVPSSNLHPAFAPIVGAIQAAPDVLRLAAYKSALRRHDWGFEYSEVGAIRRKGRDERIALEHERQVLDADSAIWNSIAHEPYRIAPPPTASDCAAMDETFEAVAA